MNNIELKYLKILGHVESASLLIMLLIAMPLRAVTGDPTFVRQLGTYHGILFLMYVYTLVTYACDHRLGFKNTLFGLVGAVVPLGPLWFEKKVLNKIAREQNRD